MSSTRERRATDAAAAGFGFGLLFEATHDAIIVVDETGTVILWNSAASRIFGYESSEAVGKNVAMIVPPEMREMHFAGIRGFQQTGHGRLIDSGRPLEVPAIRRDGTRIWIDLTLDRVQREGRAFAMAIARDVTERVELRERARTDERQLREAYESLEAFAYVLGHDLKEPVRAVAFHLDEMKSTQDAAEREAILDQARRAHGDLRKLMDGILEWSRTAMTPLEPRTLRIQELLMRPEVSAQWDFLLRERRAELVIDRDIPPVRATETLVARVFGNLITNAIRHNPDPAPRVRVRRAGSGPRGRVAIAVEDNGPGFPAALVHRVDHLKNKPTTIKGGFGLAIARRAAERLQGSLHISNAPSGGGVATVELPAAHEPDDEGLERRVRELV